jgi:hypothetical protein
MYNILSFCVGNTSRPRIRLRTTIVVALLSVFLATSTCSQPKKTQTDQRSSATVDERVSGLIGKMLNSSTEQQAFADLEALGCPAVPAIIERMDDMRSLPDRQISLKNKSPEAFEGMRFYGPQKVVDALAAILNQITGKDFGFIYNGATDAERTKTVHGWRDFLHKTPATKLCDGG